MSLEANRTVVRRLFKALDAGDVDAALSLVADNVEWWVQGTGVCEKAQLRQTWDGLFGPMSTARAMNIVGMIAEGDQIAVELESDIKLVDGRDFRNTFHIAFDIRDGVIVRAREYFDTAYVQKMFAPPAA